VSEAFAYPPEEHVLRDLRIEVERRLDPSTASAWMTAPPLAAGSSATPALGAVAVLVDVLGGGMAARAAAPDWIATADLTLHRLPPGGGEATGRVEVIEARGRVVRAGRTTVVLGVETLDDDRVSGTATLTFAVLPRRAENLVIDDILDAGRMSFAVPSSGLDVPFHDALGLAIVDPSAGVVSMPVSPYLVNSFGGVQGGIVAAVAEAAGSAAASASLGTPAVAVDLQLTYLELGKVGPVATRTTVIGTGDRHATVRVEIVDTGADDRTTASATLVCVVETGS
jgi:uncharacterized protein (TIGR00369 family)